jgi:hypothetical protein
VSVRLTSAEGVVALFDSTSGWAFGPVFEDADQAEAFLKFAADCEERDVRLLANHELRSFYGAFLAQRREDEPGT